MPDLEEAMDIQPGALREMPAGQATAGGHGRVSLEAAPKP
eukprot:CAMPEP_0177193578 /NCGR_PEP_ID=MMETSP0367-20130122/22511_1 /TAXON_ID=447022 ORGANISM="Scrippsiella hangoei-like, Strain SHHI-4" /NCGR_SAMPLE_ID=MMETSP0367 /ASSEMBLY_ACC=CAM_ASM_000362 /LENGTH=39 /DNA_ID= /DNA_START= /DNA_END= /DNA_ORIENTATION=